MNVLLVIGLVILLGTVAGRLFQKANLPQIMGYIIVGVFLGESFHGLLSGAMLDSFAPIIQLALGIIGFMIGAELNFEKFKRYSKSIYTILFFEALFTFFIVGIVTALITGKVYLGLILGALASATAPAATYNVLGEYKARGPVTMTTLSIVALDDGLALIIYGFASAFARVFIVKGDISVLNAFVMPVVEIIGSVAIGILAGYILHKILLNTREKERFLPYTLGTIIFVVGGAIFIKVNPILASMVLGAVVANLLSASNKELFDLIKRVSNPIFVLFFVLVGAELNASILIKTGVFVLAASYIVSRSVGKMLGSYIGGKISKARASVTKYLGFCLFDQAGVAVGLAIATYHSFSLISPEAQADGLLVINIITATTFMLQIVAPPMIKYGIKKADEINRNVNEEDIIEKHTVDDIMEEDFFLISEQNNLHQIIEVMKKSDSFHFPIVSREGKFLGITTLGEIRDTFYEDQMDMLVIAGDIVREINDVVYAGDPLSNAIDMFKTRKVDYIAVLDDKDNRRLIGQLEYNKTMDYISKEVLFRQQELELGDDTCSTTI